MNFLVYTNKKTPGLILILRNNTLITKKVGIMVVKVRSCEQAALLKKDSFSKSEIVLPENNSSEGNVQESKDCNEEDAGLNELIEAISSNRANGKVPQKWLDATRGDHSQALRQWKQALEWRSKNDIDNILSTLPKNYDLLKTDGSYAWYGLCKDKSLLVVQKIKHDIKRVPELQKLGVTPQCFANYVTFLNEFWVHHRISPKGRLVQVLDFKGVGLGNFSRNLLNFIGPANQALQQYPEMIEHIYIVNAPLSFRVIWTVISALLPKITLEKFSVVPQNRMYAKLSERIPDSILPEEYGGRWTMPIAHSIPERKLQAFVNTLKGE